MCSRSAQAICHCLARSINKFFEACATLRKPVFVLTKNTDGSYRSIYAIISDVFARDGVEYLQRECGELIRLDELLAIDGHEIRNFPRSAC